MDFAFSDEQQLLMRTARDFGAALRGGARRAERDGVLHPLREEYARLELLRLDWSTGSGGHGLGALDKVLVIEELANGCAGSTLELEKRCLASYLAEVMDASDTKRRLHERLRDETASFEPAVWYDADGVIGEHGGRVPFVPARAPEALIVLGPEQVATFEQGMAVHPVLPCALHAAGGCEIELSMPPTAVARPARAARERAISRLRLHLGACLLGVARAAHEHALAYTREREAFGRKIAHHQAIAFLLADMHIRVEGLRVVLHGAACAVDAGDGLTSASLAMVEACDAALSVTNLGVQLLGGHGYVKDHPVEKWYREARTLSLLLGGADAAQRDAAARWEQSA